MYLSLSNKNIFMILLQQRKIQDQRQQLLLKKNLFKELQFTFNLRRHCNKMIFTIFISNQTLYLTSSMLQIII